MELRLSVDDKFLEKNKNGIILVDNGKLKVVSIEALTNDLRKQIEICDKTIIGLKSEITKQNDYIAKLENRLIKVLEVIANE